MMQVNDAVYYDMMIEYTHARWRYYFNLWRLSRRYGTPIHTLEDSAYRAYISASVAKLLYEETLQAQRLKDAGLT